RRGVVGQGAGVGDDREGGAVGAGKVGAGKIGAEHEVARPPGARELHDAVARAGEVVGDDGDGVAGHAAPRPSSAAAGRGASSSAVGSGSRPPWRRSTNVASSGARIALTSTAEATCAVATATNGSKAGSTPAMMAGVATALPAVVAEAI